MILPRKIFKFQLLCRLEIKAQELDDYRGEEFEIFQTNWRRKIGCMLFKDHVLRNQNCSVLQYSCALFVFSVVFPLHSVDLGASGPLSCHVQMFEKPGCAPVTKKIRKTNALRGLFCLNAGEMGKGGEKK